MKRVMVDIETLSTNNNAAILSIGLAVFDPAAGVTQTEGWALSMRGVEGHINPVTVKWWASQDAAARDYSFNGAVPPLVAAHEMMRFLTDADEIWANDPDFDCVILKNWYERTVDGIPWLASFRKNRSCRTMFAIAKAKGIDLTGAWVAGTAHNPIEDAVGQARAINIILNALEIP